MMEKLPIHIGKSQGKWVPCPTCRQCTNLENIAYAVDKQNKAFDCGMPTKFQGPYASEISVHVKGSYGTKVCYVLSLNLLFSLIVPSVKDNGSIGFKSFYYFVKIEP